MGLGVAKLELKFVHRTVDRHNTVYHYFRKSGHPRTRLPGLPGSDEFMKAYGACLGNLAELQSPHQIKPGTTTALVRMWYASGHFQRLEVSTQANYRRILDSFCDEHGHKLVAQLEARHIRDIIAKKAKTPAAANQLLKRIKQIMRFALENDWVKLDPSQAVRRLTYKAKPIYTWSESDAAQFVKRHPPGTKAHLAFTIFSNTGVRKSDLVKFGRGNRRGDTLLVQQTKTDEPVIIPLAPALIAELDTVKDRMMYLQTSFGKPFTANGFGNWMRTRCDEAGLPDCSAHGLRKLIATRLAEAGCSENTISAILGWANNDQAALYTRAANKVKMARAGMKAIE
jgi:integrase